MSRLDGRQSGQIRPVAITTDYNMHAEGSVLIELGGTRVICTATVEEKVPPFMKGQGKGWVTAEYAMLPRATQVRNQRESARGKLSGRTMEIQRLIGRALRAVVDLEKLGERTITLDCDVIQADGGTRTTSITGAFVAMALAVARLHEQQAFAAFPINDFLASVSVGIVADEPLLDLCYEEDAQAKVDMNLVMTGRGQLVEIQGTGEEAPFTVEELHRLLALGADGIRTLIAEQKRALGPIADLIGDGADSEASADSRAAADADAGAEDIGTGRTDTGNTGNGNGGIGTSDGGNAADANAVAGTAADGNVPLEKGDGHASV